MDAIEKLRMNRDYMLLSSDWSQLSDADLTEAQKTAWAKYRQALRDLPAKFEGGAMIDWPQPPSK